MILLTFQEEEDGNSKFSSADEDQQTACDDPGVKQEDVKYGENHDKSEKHVTDYNNVPPENFESENLNPNGDEDTRENDPHGRARGHSWTSDDGHTWGQQSSFDSHGEADDNCFSDCSPSNPPTNLFGSPRKSQKDGEQGEQKSTQETGDASAQDKNHEEDTRNEKKDSREKENDDGVKEKQKLNDEKLEYDDEISNDEDGEFDAETDFDDDENFDDGDDDYEEEDVDQDENEHGKKSDKRRKQNHGDEDDGEQDDLEQEEEPEDKISKRARRKKRRRRKLRQKKCKEDEAENKENIYVVCDPTEICDTFMAASENAASDDIETKTANDDAIEGCCEIISAAAVTNTGDQNDAKTQDAGSKHCFHRSSCWS